MSDLASRLVEFMRRNKRGRISLEAGRGETYGNGRPTLYGHGVYERPSVLAGQPKRQWLEQWDTVAEARAAIAEAVKIAKVKVHDEFDSGASSHIPVAVMTRHLPDDEG